MVANGKKLRRTGGGVTKIFELARGEGYVQGPFSPYAGTLSAPEWFAGV